MKIIYFVLICCILIPCTRIYAVDHSSQEAAFSSGSPTPAAATRDTLPGEIITVPVVIHLLYNTAVQNISDAQVLSQLKSLNNDYRKLNDISKIPPAFAGLSADARIVFCLAKTDAKGKSTTGIIRKYTRIANWMADDAMKFSASGGDDAWDSKTYLNIWVCNLFGRSLGYSSLPGSAADKDGVVIQYDVFGTTGTVRAPFDKGRTATHEIGHWLGLLHLWGDALCGDDKIDDTPPQKSYNNGMPAFPHVSACSVNGNGDMFMDFMDFTDDAAMSMFTYGQVRKMRGMFSRGNLRNSFLNSSACNSPAPIVVPSVKDTTTIAGTDAPESIDNEMPVSLYPNPAKNFVIIEAANNNILAGQTLRIYNMMGGEVKRQLLTAAKNTILINNLPAGIYVAKIGQGKEIKILRLVKQ